MMGEVERWTASNSLVLIADLQPPMLAGNRTCDEAQLKQAVTILVEATAKLNVPILRSVVSLGPGHVPEVIDELKGEAPIERPTVGVFDDEPTLALVKDLGRRRLAIGGISSEIAVLHAVLGARRCDYDVQVLVDCCGGFSARTEDAAFRQMEAAGATLGNVASYLSGLVPGLSDPLSRAVFGSLSRLWS